MTGLKYADREIHWIVTQSGVGFLSAMIEREKEICIDLEFDRNKIRYGFNLCLIQIAGADFIALVDPLIKLDLAPLWKALEDGVRLKILHAGGEDLRLLSSLGCHLKNIYDTQLAAMILGCQRTAMDHLAMEMLGVNIDKTQQRSNWYRRPLLPAQVVYGAGDVAHLIALKAALEKNLKAAGRYEWNEQERLALEDIRESTPDEEPWISGKDMKEFGPLQRYVLREFLKWRDSEAKRLDKPPYQVMDNDLMRAIVKEPVKHFSCWSELRGIHPALRRNEARDRISGLLEEFAVSAKKLADENRLESHRPPLTHEQREAKHREKEISETIFIPLKHKIVEKYGSMTGGLILSSAAIAKLAGGEQTLSTLRPWKREILLETARIAGSDLSFCL